jgi:putative ABC transport system permease protein
MLMNLWFDIRYAVRLALKSPGHFALCTMVVALSVGLALWAWVLVYTLALKPLPFPQSASWQSVQVAATATAGAAPRIDAYTYQEVLKRSRSVDHLGALSSRTAMLSQGRTSTRLRAAEISPRLLAATQAAPLMGRLFEETDAQRGATETVVLSHATWANHFASDPAVIGKQARIDGRPVQVIGVMPQSYFGFQDFEIWFPLQLQILNAPADSERVLTAFVRLGSGQQPAAVLDELSPAVAEANRNHPQLFDAGRHLVLVPAHRTLTHGLLPVATTISLVAAAVLLLGCVNISLVFFARLLERSRELALRVALGASRGRLLGQCMLETLLIMIPGLLLGVGLTALGVGWARGLSEFVSQYLANGRDGNPLSLRATDLLVAALIVAVLWLLTTLIPSWRIAGQDAASSLNGGAKGSAATGKARSAGLLVGLQVVVSSLVLVLCMNLLTALSDEAGKPTGVDSSRVVLSTYPTDFGPARADLAARSQYLQQLVSAVTDRVPGTQVAFATAVPTRPDSLPVAIENQAQPATEGRLELPVTAVSEGYFTVLKVALRAGRAFDGTDSETSTPVTVIDEVTARRYWPNVDPLGKRIQLDPEANGPWLTVVGVTAAVGHEPYQDSVGILYRPFRQANPSSFLLIAKLPDASADRRADLHAAAFATDQDLPLNNLQSLDDYLAALDVTYTSLMPVFGAVSAITVLLASSGLFGLISRSVVRRTQEIGVRRALGSTAGRIVGLFLRQSAVYMAAGVVGVALGLLLANLLSAQIPNILTHAPLVAVGVLFLIGCVVFLATYLPTRRAVALELADALRYE